MSIVSRGDTGILVTQSGNTYQFRFPMRRDSICQLHTLPPVAQVAMCGNNDTGKHYAVVCRKGTMWTWGANNRGQTGNGVMPAVSIVPYQLSPEWFAHQYVASVSCGSECTFAVTDVGRVYSFGSGVYGQLGHGRSGFEATKSVPTLIEGLEGVVVAMLATDENHSVCVSNDGRVWSWGYNSCRQLGIEGVDAEYVSVPTPVTGLDKESDVVFASTSSVHSTVVTTKGTVLAWGSNKYGQCGIGSTMIVHTPTLVVFRDNETPTSSEGQPPDIAHAAKRVKTGDGDFQGQVQELGSKPATPSIYIKTTLCMTLQTIAIDSYGHLWWSGYAGSFASPSMRSHSKTFVRVPAERTVGLNITALCSANHTTVALADDGLLYAMHTNRHVEYSPDSMPRLVSASIFDDSPIGLYALFSTHTKLAFAMGMHRRLGEVGHLLGLTDDLLHRILTVCNGHVVQSEGVRRLCGGWVEDARNLGIAQGP